MDARSQCEAIPLAVDLDGTLIATDLLWEGLFLLLRQRPLCLFLLPFWLLDGKARLKCEIAERVVLDPVGLPYRSTVLARIQDARSKGRRIVLATASPRKFAEVIAGYLGVFDAVLSTERGCNMASHVKRDALVKAFGDGGFQYAGDSRADIAVFDAAHSALVVAPDRAAARWQARNGSELIEADAPTFKAYLKMIRAHQWLKNVLVFIPLILMREYTDMGLLIAGVLAFISFSAAASSIYILNDFFDLSLDRRHPSKCHRPFASGAVSIPFGFAIMGALLVISIGTALFLPPLFLLTLGAYLLATSAYSISIKRMLLIDVLTLAGLYTLRILAGAAATGVSVSFWLLAFSIFFFLSLAMVKRFVELRGTALPVGERIAGRGYRPEDIEVIAQAGMGAAFSAAMVLALYIQSSSVNELYTYPWMIWPLSPIILYITMRIWILARRDEMLDDPVVFIIRDWRSQLVGGFGALLLLVAGWI